MGQIQVNCPTCGVLNEMPASLAGTTVECGGCGAPFQVAPLDPPPARRPSRARPSQRPAQRSSRGARERAGRAAGPRGRSRRPAGPPVGAITAVVLIAIIAVVGVLFGKSLIGSNSGDTGNGELPVADGGPANTNPRRVEPSRPGPKKGEVVRTTLAALVTSSHPPGTEVRFKAVIYPASLVQVTGMMGAGGRTFALALDRDAALFSRIRKFRTAVDSWVSSGLDRVASAIDDDETFIPRATELNEFLKEMNEGLKVEPSASACAVRLKGIERVAGQTEWRTVINEGPPSPEEFMKKWRKENPFRPGGPRGPALPESRPSAAEIREERAASIESIRVALLIRRSMLRRMLDQPSREYTAIVEKPVDIAVRTFAKGGRLAPKVFVKETGPYESTFAARYYGKTDILLTSRPSGATVTRNGALVGTTPVIIRDLKVGGRLEVELTLEGHEKQSRGIDVELSPNGCVRVNTMLWPKEK
jgi:hypothetical protein